jgi:orotate phosphoribosyltransferase
MIPGRRNFISFLIANQALRFGEFVLKSGDTSPFFVDLGQIRTGRALDHLGVILAHELQRHFPRCDVYFGPAYKGIPMATAAAAASHRLFDTDPAVCFDRKEQKGHGEKGGFIGHTPAPDDRIVIIDDVVSSGGTKFEAMQAIESRFGVRPEGVLVCVDRCRRKDQTQLKKLNLHAVVTLSDIVRYLEEQDDKRAATLRQFYGG